jgi:hypothetical protein
MAINFSLLKERTKASPVFQGKFDFVSNHSIFTNNFITFKESLGYTTEKTFLFPFSEGSREGFRGYDSDSIFMQRYLSSTIQYHHHLWDRLFAVSFAESNQSVLINPFFNGAHLNENTIGAGLRYYFKKITIPGVNFEYAYNLNDKSSHMHFSLGGKF